jgi:hypothetical protein
MLKRLEIEPFGIVYELVTDVEKQKHKQSMTLKATMGLEMIRRVEIEVEVGVKMEVSVELKDEGETGQWVC